MKKLLVVAVSSLVCSLVSSAPLSTIKVTNDRAPDCSSLEALVASVTRDCPNDDAKAIAIYNVARYLYYHHAYPSEPNGIGALKMINGYGWSLCGGQHTVLAALWEKAGFKWRYRGWSNPGHTTVECYYGGRWHYLDTFLKFYTWMPEPTASDGRTIAGQEDIRANPALVTDAFVTDSERKVCYHQDNRFEFIRDKVNWTAPAFMVCGDTLDGVLTGIASSKNAGSPRGWSGIKFDEPDYSTDVNLGVGYALTLDWDKIEGAYYFRGMKRGPGHSCGDKDYRNCPAIGPLLEPYAGKDPRRSWSNGTLTFRPDFRNDAFLTSLQQADNVTWEMGSLKARDAQRAASFVVEMASPYVVAKASGNIVGTEAKSEVSLDGKTWKSAKLSDLTPEVAGSYRYFLRVTFTKPLTGLQVTSIVQHNQEALPYLAPGKNTITINAANPDELGRNRLVVTYAYCLGWRDVSPEEVYERGAEIARAHYATWSDKPIVVQKAVDTFPCAFEIPVPTPQGKQPVYPRMRFLRREVLAPGQEPMSVPSPASMPVVRANEVLATLPTPWLIGTQKPAARAELPTQSSITPLNRLSYVSMAGETFPHQFVKWLKDNSNAWIMLIGAEGIPLPAPRDLASAKLTFYVSESHDKADMQAAAVILQAPFVSGQPYNFKQLGDMAGSTIIKQGRGPDQPFSPPMRYEIDVTKAVRKWASGETPYGLALRIIPNRSIDDGWTVRFTPDAKQLPSLTITTYTER